MTWLNRWLGGDIRQLWFKDLLASLVVFLVAMPLCMGIALASGAPIASGLVTGIVGGLVVGLFAGAPLQVSGPAAGLTVICGEVIREHGLPALGVTVIIAGGLQLAAGIFRIGQWFRAVSPAVIHGMLSGIGVLILSSQLHVMVDDRPREGGLANLLSIPSAVWKGLPPPARESAAMRQARRDWLQQFGRLHERQAEIESHTSRLLSPQAPASQHSWGASRLNPFVPQQEALLAELRAAAKGVRSVTNTDAGGGATAARDEAIGLAIQRGEQALADLQAHDPERVAQSQPAASQALAAVLAGLKDHAWAAKVGLLSIAIIIAWQGLAPRRLRLLPGPLLAVVTVTVLAWLWSLPVLYVEVPESLAAGLTFPSLSVFEHVPLGELLLGGVMMALVASAETLLCASAVDRMHQGPRTQYDRELAAQGVGNLLCGLVGGLPMTGVIVRSATNVQAGAKSRLSAILHGLWLLLFVVVLGSLLRLIPTAALAGILVYTGFKLIDWKAFIHLWRTSRSEAFIFIATLTVIVVEDLLSGVVTGIVLSALKLLVTFSRLDVQLDRDTVKASGRTTLRLGGAATFLRLPALAAKLDEVPKGAHLHVDFQQLDYIDHACLELLMSWEKQHESAGGRLYLDWGELHARFREVRRNGASTADQPAAMTAVSDTPASVQLKRELPLDRQADEPHFERPG